MWVCLHCHQSIEDSENSCYHCGSAKTLTAEGLHVQLLKEAETGREDDRAEETDGEKRNGMVREWHFGNLRERSFGFKLRLAVLAIVGILLVVDATCDLEHFLGFDRLRLILIGAACLVGVGLEIVRVTLVAMPRPPQVPKP